MECLPRALAILVYYKQVAYVSTGSRGRRAGLRCMDQSIRLRRVPRAPAAASATSSRWTYVHVYISISRGPARACHKEQQQTGEEASGDDAPHPCAKEGVRQQLTGEDLHVQDRSTGSERAPLIKWMDPPIGTIYIDLSYIHGLHGVR